MPLLSVRAVDAHRPRAQPYKITLDRGLQLRIRQTAREPFWSATPSRVPTPSVNTGSPAIRRRPGPVQARRGVCRSGPDPRPGPRGRRLDRSRGCATAVRIGQQGCTAASRWPDAREGGLRLRREQATREGRARAQGTHARRLPCDGAGRSNYGQGHAASGGISVPDREQGAHGADRQRHPRGLRRGGQEVPAARHLCNAGAARRASLARSHRGRQPAGPGDCRP